MKLLVGERRFQEFRDDSLTVTGPFKALTSVTPTAGQQNANHANYQVLAQFEKQDGVLFTMTLSSGGKVEGLELTPQHRPVAAGKGGSRGDDISQSAPHDCCGRVARVGPAPPSGRVLHPRLHLSWLVWIPAGLTGAGQLLIVLGAFGPAVAAFIVLRATGGSVGAWARQILHWRVPPRWYLYALGLPALLFAVVNGTLTLLGKPIDLSLLVERAPSYLAGFAFVALLGGGQEEPGWRGFALPRLQQRLTPLRATALLAFLWGLWHLPIYGLGFVGPMLFAVFYTYLYNRTGSVGLCMLLHGSFTAALDNLTLTPDNLTVDLTILATLLAATLVLVAVTRGRLGFQPTTTVAGGDRAGQPLAERSSR